MIRTTLAAAFLLLTAPVHAQSFFPSIYADRFCQLHQLGISGDAARKAAMEEAWSKYRKPTFVPYNGQSVSLDVLDAARLVVTNCPEAVK